MNIYATEEEQVEQIKKLWRDYGKTFLVMVACCFLAVSAWRYWQHYRANQRDQAVVIYQAMLTNSLDPKQAKAVTEDAQRLVKQFSDTPYASIAGLLLAKQAVAKGDLPAAKKQLLAVLQQTKLPVLKQLARLRLATVNLGLGQQEAALALLTPVVDPAFKPLLAELKGDIYANLKQGKQAQQAYAEALANLPADGLARPILQLKHDHYPSVS